VAVFDSAKLDQGLEDCSATDPTAVAEIRLRSGDPEDLTLRDARLLGSADLVLYDPAVPESVLNRARADAERRPASHPGGPAKGRTVIIRRD